MNILYWNKNPFTIQLFYHLLHHMENIACYHKTLKQGGLCGLFSSIYFLSYSVLLIFLFLLIFLCLCLCALFNPQSLSCASYESTPLSKSGLYIPYLLSPYMLAPLCSRLRRGHCHTASIVFCTAFL